MVTYPLYFGLAALGISVLGIVGLIIALVIALAVLGKVKVKTKDITLGPTDKYGIDGVVDKLLAEVRWRGLNVNVTAKTDTGTALMFSNFFEEIELWVRRIKDQTVITYNIHIPPGFIVIATILILFGWPWTALLAGLWYARYRGRINMIEESAKVVGKVLS